MQPNTPAASARRSGLAAAFAVAMLAASLPAAADRLPSDAVAIRGDFSGHWFDPAQNGQGIQIEVLDGSRAALTWYAFDPDGAPLWLFGVLQVDGARLAGPLSSARGGRFPTVPGASAVAFEPWGTVTFEAAGCDTAELHFDGLDPAFGDGRVALQRLTSSAGTRCNVEEEFAEQRSFHFERGPAAFDALFADLPATGQDIYELDFGWEALPAPLSGHRGLRLTGHNRSDDLAMYVVAPVAGLQPEHRYAVELEAEFASDVPTGCAGVGGSPGDSVYLKLGASTVQPQAVVVDEGGFDMLRMNIDTGNQSEGGLDVKVVGTLANSQSCEDGPQSPWELQSVSTRGQPLIVRSDAQGRIWVLAGSDSAFEGLTRHYITRLQLRLDPRGD